MHAAERSITLDQPTEWAMFAKWLTDVDAGLKPYGRGLSPRMLALRDRARLWAQEARAVAEKQPETTSPVVTGHPSGTMTTRQVADRLGCSTQYVTKQARCGRLPGFRVAGIWQFDVFDVDEYNKERAA